MLISMMFVISKTTIGFVINFKPILTFLYYIIWMSFTNIFITSFSKIQIMIKMLLLVLIYIRPNSFR